MQNKTNEFMKKFTEITGAKFVDVTPKTELDLIEQDGQNEKNYEDMYVGLGKNETEQMERRFNIWLSNRDDDFELDIWQFRCLQDFIFQEITKLLEKKREKLCEEVKKLKQARGEVLKYGVLIPDKTIVEINRTIEKILQIIKSKI